MSKAILRNAGLPALLAGGFVLLDLILDGLRGGSARLDPPHVILGAVVLLVSYMLMSRAVGSRRRAEAVLRQARDEMESRVRERTAELGQANEALRTEVADRKRIEQALRTSEETARALMNASTESAVLIDTQGIVVAANETGAQGLGTTAARMVGASLFGLFSPEVAERRKSYLSDVLRTRQPAYYEDERDGRLFDIHIHPVSDSDGNIIRLAVFGRDITERKQAEASIRHLSSFPQLNPNPILEIDALGTILYSNPAVTKTLERLGLEDDARAFFPDDLAVVLQELERTKESAFEREVHVGSAIFAETVHVIPAFNVVRIYAFDVIQRKRAEEALRASEEKYRLLFQNMAEGFALYELLYDEQGQPADWRVLEVNDAYTRHTGIARDRIVGRRISELFPAALSEYLARFAAVVATQSHSDFETYAKAVGRHQRVITFPAGGHRFASTIEDVTERKRTEEALRASEEKFSTAFHLSPDAIGIARVADGAVLDVNEAFTTILGYSRSDVVGRRWTELGLLVTSDEFGSITELFVEKGHVADYELSLTTKTGGVATVLVSLIAIAVSGEPCILAIAHDVTKRKQSEEALRRAQEELVQRVQERSALEERQRLARELHDSVSQALYGISLGVNTALTLFDADRAKVLEALQYTLALSHDGLTEMRALIFELRPESLKTEGLVTALARQIAAARARYNIEIELGLCDEPDVPLPVKEALYRIAQEALQNAARHARSDRLSVRLAQEPAALILEVCDNGVGFDSEASYPGHLGLQSMRERAMKVGGALDIISAPDCGTQVRIHIPVSANATTQAA